MVQRMPTALRLNTAVQTLAVGSGLALVRHGALRMPTALRLNTAARRWQLAGFGMVQLHAYGIAVKHRRPTLAVGGSGMGALHAYGIAVKHRRPTLAVGRWFGMVRACLRHCG